MMSFGSDAYRKQLRKRISSKITNPDNQIARLEKRIEEKPKAEQNYLNLIYLYSQNNQKEKAYGIAKLLLEQKPKSELVHLALYKFYLNDSKIEEAIHSMKIALKSDKIENQAKHKVLNDFLVFVNKNPQYESELGKVVSLLSSEENNKVLTELGHYYYKKDQKELALNFYERSIKNNFNDFALLKRILLLQLDLKRYDKAEAGSTLVLEIYPAQPIFYLVNGISLINLEKTGRSHRNTYRGNRLCN